MGGGMVMPDGVHGGLVCPLTIHYVTLLRVTGHHAWTRPSRTLVRIDAFPESIEMISGRVV